MKNKKTIIVIGLFITILSIVLWYTRPVKTNNNFSALAKVALRDVGHQLLQAKNDATSVVLPVIEKSTNRFVLSFEAQLAINPDSLIRFTQQSFQKAKLPNTYLLEVFQCNTSEVAYSYTMNKNKNKAIIPCRGRILPQQCYRIEVQFTDVSTSKNVPMAWYYILFSAAALALILQFKKKPSVANQTTITTNENYTAIGSFQFYPEQNKLVKQAQEISLSRKECEILAIFIDKPNQIIKREELIKKVWEDQGVVVGRSLDTYISKLRKKLKDDDRIKLTNVHGVGYKLEVS